MEASATPTTKPSLANRAARLALSPTWWHVASLVVGFAFIMVLQRSQWFFFDEWVFVKFNGPSVFAPHVGHWSTSAVLVWYALRGFFGLNSYLPFALVVTLFHLAIAHLVWRIARLAGAGDWIATAAVAVLVFLGTGAENILWAFQIGFLGGLGLGLLAFYLATGENVSRRRFVAILAVALFALTWSGTAIPLVAATAALLARRRGIRSAAIFGAATMVVYLGWYALFAVGSGGNPDTGGLAPHKILVLMPQFIGVLLLKGFPLVFPITAVGWAVELVALAWVILLAVRKKRLPGFSLALILAFAAALFAFMTAFSRATMSIGSGMDSRYAYVLVVLLLPIFAVGLTRFSRNRRAWTVAVCVLLLGLTVFQSRVLVDAARAQSERELGSERLISAALFLYVEAPETVDPTKLPDARWAPNVDLQDVVDLYDQNIFPIGYFTKADLAAAEAAVGRAG